MAEAVRITRHTRELSSIFDLLGDQENDITAALGWTLSRSSRFLHGFIGDLLASALNGAVTEITLQESGPEGGYTDVTLRVERGSCIIEAKQGWHLPGPAQLEKYARRVADQEQRALLVVSECSRVYARPPRLPKSVLGVPVLHHNWQHVDAIAARAAKGARGAERQLLSEFRTYLRRVTSMRDQQSNRVYVVALADGLVEGGSISWQDIITEKRQYFHPYGRGGWPVDPPNYLAFRYQGKLQAIHHVKRYEVVDEPNRYIPEVPLWGAGDYVLYWLGPPIRPPHGVRSTRMRAARCWAAIDLLLTCSTVPEARDKTKERLSEDAGS
jgi:hypothetical protein